MHTDQKTQNQAYYSPTNYKSWLAIIFFCIIIEFFSQFTGFFLIFANEKEFFYLLVKYPILFS